LGRIGDGSEEMEVETDRSGGDDDPDHEIGRGPHTAVGSRKRTGQGGDAGGETARIVIGRRGIRQKLRVTDDFSGIETGKGDEYLT